MAQQDDMFEGSIKRTPRATQTREKAAARKPWAPPFAGGKLLSGFCCAPPPTPAPCVIRPPIA